MERGINTRCLHLEETEGENDHYGAISYPIYQTATYAHPGVGQSMGYDYSRLQNPTREYLEKTVAGLEWGIDAFALSSGMAAITLLMELFEPGDHIIAEADLYGGSVRLFNNVSKKNQYEFTYLNCATDDIESHIKENTKAIYIETPTNPMMNVSDIEKIAGIAKRNHCLLIVDNTFLSPYFQNPLKLGADIVIHSGTKFLGGHNDTLAGFIVTNNEEVDEKLRFLIKTTGSGLAPFDCWLILRGIKTLGIRMERAQDNARVVISNDLYLGEDNKYHIDFEDFEKKIAENHIKLFFLCSPHNPSGRVFTEEELRRLGDICLQYGVIVVSDEIHHDFVFQGKHHVFASLGKEYEDISLVCTSPSKTFNLASMLISNIFIPNRKLKARFRKQVDAAGISQLSALGLVAVEAAYGDGEEWYQAMHSYVGGNIAYAKKYVAENLPGVKVIDGEGTYLVWLDFRDLGIEVEELDRRMIQDAKLWLDSGKIFGDTGRGFQRINVAAPRAIITECLERIRKVFINK